MLDADVRRLEDELLEQKWFYDFQLPSGRHTKRYISDEVEHIHRTRRDMMLAELAPLFDDHGSTLTAIDVASHQGWFSFELAKRCAAVKGIEFQQRHVDSARKMGECLGVTNATFAQGNVETMSPHVDNPADIVINFGLMYNLENPIGALRRCREMTKRVLLVETQCTILDLEGKIDSGHSSNTNYMHGYWGVFDGNPENIDGSASAIVFYPSPKGLCWVLTKLGFSNVSILTPPQGAYQQLATGKRVMVAAYV